MAEMLETASRQYDDGDLRGAEQACLQVLQTEPRHVQALRILGGVCHQFGRHAEAIAYFERATSIDSANPDLYNNLGVAYAAAGKLEKGMAHLREALRRKPDHADAHNNLGAALADKCRFAEAIGHYRQALQLKPDRAKTHNNLANSLVEEGRLQEAEHHYGEAARLQPDYAETYCTRAKVLIELGRLAEATACCHEALRLDPDCVRAYINLGAMAAQGHYRFADDQVRRMESIATADDLGRVRNDGRCLSIEAASSLHFTLAALYDLKNEYDRAFSHYRQANDFKAQVFREKNRDFDRESHRRYVHAIIDVCDRRFFERVRSFGLATEVPVFIVGMPRSGSTLVEQILSSHPQVVAAGERRELSQMLTDRGPYPAHLSLLDQTTARALGEEYLSCLSRIGPEAGRVVDKQLHNYLHLGSICALFPKARIIHCRRNVMDLCLSCYFQDFAWVNYATSLEDLGFYYRQYERLMRHWREVLPMSVYEVDYEELVRDQERVSRELIAYCGLDWSDRCFAFHENRRAVQTASRLQVRRPMYASSIARWKRYESHLAPLQQALAADPAEAVANTAALAGPLPSAALDMLFASFGQEFALK
jgi:tetratricopeptide (TPR) repeat protein